MTLEKPQTDRGNDESKEVVEGPLETRELKTTMGVVEEPVVVEEPPKTMELQTTRDEVRRKAVNAVPGVIEYYGQEAKDFRMLIRGMEDVLDKRGFEELNFGGVVPAQVFLQNLDFLGERFKENLVHANVNGEQHAILPPEGTMLTYNYLSRAESERAKVFYSSNFTRNENPEDVAKGKTRNFHQIGFEIFNHPLFEGSLEAIRATAEMLRSSGLDGNITVRIADKRLINGLCRKYPEMESRLLLGIIDKADDNPDKLRDMYFEAGGTNQSVIDEVCAFMKLARNSDLSPEHFTEFGDDSPIFKAGLENISSLKKGLAPDVDKGDFKLQILPFMAKSWDACNQLLFDVRYPGYNAAIAGGGNLVYLGYKPDAPKSGAGIGVTRVYDILRGKR